MSHEAVGVLRQLGNEPRQKRTAERAFGVTSTRHERLALRSLRDAASTGCAPGTLYCNGACRLALSTSASVRHGSVSLRWRSHSWFVSTLDEQLGIARMERAERDNSVRTDLQHRLRHAVSIAERRRRLRPAGFAATLPL
jgi:hypothetical protein